MCFKANSLQTIFFWKLTLILEAGDSLGIKLMHIFCDQLEGEMTISNGPGFTLSIHFPLPATNKSTLHEIEHPRGRR